MCTINFSDDTRNVLNGLGTNALIFLDIKIDKISDYESSWLKLRMVDNHIISPTQKEKYNVGDTHVCNILDTYSGFPKTSKISYIQISSY